MTKKWTADQLTRLAFVHGEDDRRAMAEAQGNNEYGRECSDLADAMHAYRMKRWGRTEMEARTADAKLVDIRDLPKGDRQFREEDSENKDA